MSNHSSGSSHSAAPSGHGSCSLDVLKAEAISCHISDVRNATDFSFVLICAFLIFFMKAGFVMLEYGACNLGPTGRRLLLRMKVIDTVLGALAFWLVGYSIAFTPKDFDFNHLQFADLETGEEHVEQAHSTELWEFHFAFAANAATVVTGAVVGRVQLIGYVLGTIALTGFVHPFAASWVWNPDGWLTSVGLTEAHPGIWGTNGFIDFAGAVVIHMLGAVAALVCVVFAGRSNRPAEKSDEYVATLGVLILWFSWYGFCCGTADGMSEFRYVVVTHIALVVTLSIASAGCTMFIMQAIRQVRKAHNVPKWELGKDELVNTERRLPRREMIAQVTLLKSCVRRAVRIYKQARIVIDRLAVSSDDKDSQWAQELKGLRTELRKVWHTGNGEVIDEKADDLLQRMEGGAFPPTQDNSQKPSPALRKAEFQKSHQGHTAFHSTVFKTMSFLDGSNADANNEVRQGGDAPFVDWTVHDDKLVILLCGMRNRYPLGHHFAEEGEHHELHPSVYEIIILSVVFIVSLPALLPILLFLLAMAYLGPVDRRDEEFEKLRLEHEHETTPDADPRLVNSDLVDWYLLQREKKKQNLLSDHDEIELESLGLEWYPRIEDINLLEVLHAMVVGLVAITAGGNVLPSYMAVVIGVCCVFFYELGVIIEQLFQLHDALHAFPVHGMGGLCGAIFASFSFIHNRDGRFELFYQHPYLGEPYRQWLVQYLGLITVSLWVIGSMLVVYGTVWYFDLLAMHGVHFNKWRISVRQHDATVWAKLKDLFYHAAFKGLCGERVIRHDQDDTAIPLEENAESRKSTSDCSPEHCVRSSAPEVSVFDATSV